MIHKITLPTPFAIGSINVFLLEEPLTLIDTGIKTEEVFQYLKGHIEKRGYSLKDLQRIIITHGHVDHSGLGERLRSLSGAKVYCHIEDADKINGTVPFFQSREPYAFQAGVPMEIILRLREQSREMIGVYEDPIEDFIPIEDDHLFPFENFTLKAIHTPGHSKGHICLYHERDKLLLCGDHLINHITPVPSLETEGNKRVKSLVNYLKSLEKIEGLEVRRAFPAHGKEIEDHRLLIRKLFIHHEKRKEAIYSLIKKGINITYELVRAYFKDISDFEIILAVSEILAHIDLLMDEGRVEAEEKEGVLYYYSQR